MTSPKSNYVVLKTGDWERIRRVVKEAGLDKLDALSNMTLWPVDVVDTLPEEDIGRWKWTFRRTRREV